MLRLERLVEEVLLRTRSRPGATASLQQWYGAGFPSRYERWGFWREDNQRRLLDVNPLVHGLGNYL